MTPDEQTRLNAELLPGETCCGMAGRSSRW